MKRIFYILLTICIFNINVSANNKNVNWLSHAKSSLPRLSLGVEWSYIGTSHYATRYNYFDSEGYRKNKTEKVTGYWSNAEALLHIGYNLSSNWNISLYSGIMGIADIHNAVPFSLRATYYFGKDPVKDRWFTYADIGTGICLKQEPQEILTGKIGGGYRFSLSRDAKLDIIAAMRLCYTHPQIYDGDEIIIMEWTNRNTALVKSISVGIGLTF